MAASFWIERAQPWLGTIVKIGMTASDQQSANDAIDAAFAEVGLVHRLMSFHEPGSDISAINRSAPGAVRIHPRTAEVLRIAREIANESDGVFDITIAPRLVARGLLPHPQGGSEPDPQACWRDLELVEADRVYLRRSLWLDLGGIAKGYAVDAATSCLMERAPGECYVNAGGDLRVAGGTAHKVFLNVPCHAPDIMPTLEVSNSSVASSAAPGTACTGTPVGPHIDGRSGSVAEAGRFATVLTDRCVIADALTKVALCAGAAGAAVLERYQATALLFHPCSGWLTLGNRTAAGPEMGAPCAAIRGRSA